MSDNIVSKLRTMVLTSKINPNDVTNSLQLNTEDSTLLARYVFEHLSPIGDVLHFCEFMPLEEFMDTAMYGQVLKLRGVALRWFSDGPTAIIGPAMAEQESVEDSE